MKKRFLSFLLCALMLMSVVVPAAAQDDAGEPEPAAIAKPYTVTKISNPDRGEREVDGLIEGGDRENSYTWRLAMRGDEIYIATTRNIASALVNMYAGAFAEAGISLDTFWALIDVVTNGDIPRNDANEGANIISYNRSTGKFKVIYTADTGDYFRMAVTFGEDVYFGSYSAVPTNPQYILKLDTDGSFTKVFQTMGSVSLRANCVYDDHLFFAGADDREVVPEGEEAPVAKMAVLRKSNEDDTVWERVADYRDFGATAFDPIHTSWAGAPIWELADHNGYIYATAPTHSGFVIYKGHPASEGETANEYGWYWEEVAGPTNGINNPGLSDVKGGEPGTMRSLIGSVYEFNGELYAYNFDHSFGGEASAFAGMLQQLAGKDVKASEYLFYMYNSLQNPQKVWKLNDETGKFEELTAFTELMKGTANEYVWRLGEYDGDLYIATMDAGIFYNYLTQLTNGSFFRMTPQEKQEKLSYITKLITMIANSKASETLEPLKAKLEELKAMLENFNTDEIADESDVTELQKCSALLVEIKAFADNLIEKIENTDLSSLIDSIIGDMAADNENLVPTGASTELAEVSAIIRLMPEDYLASLMETAQQLLEKYPVESVKNMISEKLKAALREVLSKLSQTAEELYQKIDGDGIAMYLYINETVKNDKWGFDLFRTADGKSFEVITRDGFGDRYNYGCPSFLETEEGLYFGTCNPFYGGQLYLLTNMKDEPLPVDKSKILGDADGDGDVTIFDATVIQKYLASEGDGSTLDIEVADVDRDGEISIFDVTAIQRFLADLTAPEGIGEPITSADAEP